MVTPDQVDAAMPSDQNSGARRTEGILRTLLELPPSVAKALEPVVAGLVEQVRLAIEQLSLTAAQIATLVANPGAIAPTTVTASGDVSSAGDVSVAGDVVALGVVAAGGDLSTGGDLLAPSVYSTTLSTDYRAVWVSNPTGQLGYVPSSLKFKQDVETAILDDRLMVALRLVTFRYIQAVEDRGSDAETVVGMIAEEVHELGATWLVDYDDHDEPFGLKYDRVLFVVMSWGQRADERLTAIESHLGLTPPGS
jgi:hypothetical protein